MQGLDDYITNSKYSEWWADLACSRCGTEWSALIFTEYGRSYFKDQDKMYCPECGTIENTQVVEQPVPNMYSVSS